jgi:hypothetical protein
VNRFDNKLGRTGIVVAAVGIAIALLILLFFLIVVFLQPGVP